MTAELLTLIADVTVLYVHRLCSRRNSKDCQTILLSAREDNGH